MRIIYDNVSSEYVYPLSKTDILKAKLILPLENVGKIRTVRFGCNTKTTQEGRIVARGRYYDIRVNFCLYDKRSKILSDKKEYFDQINDFGGIIELKTNSILWESTTAKRYGLFLFFHEFGHMIFSEERSVKKLGGTNSKFEELWCDQYALKKLQEYESKVGLVSAM